MATKKPMTKGQFLGTIADATELPKKKVAAVFDAMSDLLKKELKGAGLLNIAGLMKVTVIRKPATKAREGINPFTKEKIMIKAKPARNVIKVRALKTLKDMV
ncbi:MAG: HU family DNA-binding protein [Planctomycetaceae bacterium]|nr:HU family DNA-binding protein [Planctomycetaceae bacterium]